MKQVTADITLVELAALVSQALQAAGITATLSGGGAVSLYSRNAYQSYDLDFVTFERTAMLERALEPLGFTRIAGAREFRHGLTPWSVEFPPGPLAFGERRVDDSEACFIETEFGPLRIVSPTHIVMDRLAAFVHWRDRQSFDQAVLIAAATDVDWADLATWAADEGIEPDLIERLRKKACADQ